MDYFSAQRQHTARAVFGEATVVCGSGRGQWLALEITEVSSQKCGVSSSYIVAVYLVAALWSRYLD